MVVIVYRLLWETLPRGVSKAMAAVELHAVLRVDPSDDVSATRVPHVCVGRSQGNETQGGQRKARSMREVPHCLPLR